MQDNTNQNNSKYGHFLRSVTEKMLNGKLHFLGNEYCRNDKKTSSFVLYYVSGDIVRQIVGKYVIHYLQLMHKDE